MSFHNFIRTPLLLALGFTVQPCVVPTRAQRSAGFTPTTANQPAMAVLEANGSWIFRKQVNEVTVMFTATRKGKLVTDLQLADVEVKDDKKAPEASSICAGKRTYRFD